MYTEQNKMGEGVVATIDHDDGTERFDNEPGQWITVERKRRKGTGRFDAVLETEPSWRQERIERNKALKEQREALHFSEDEQRKLRAISHILSSTFERRFDPQWLALQQALEGEPADWHADHKFQNKTKVMKEWEEIILETVEQDVNDLPPNIYGNILTRYGCGCKEHDSVRLFMRHVTIGVCRSVWMACLCGKYVQGQGEVVQHYRSCCFRPGLATVDKTYGWTRTHSDEEALRAYVKDTCHGDMSNLYVTTETANMIKERKAIEFYSTEYNWTLNHARPKNTKNLCKYHGGRYSRHFRLQPSQKTWRGCFDCQDKVYGKEFTNARILLKTPCGVVFKSLLSLTRHVLGCDTCVGCRCTKRGYVFKKEGTFQLKHKKDCLLSQYFGLSCPEEGCLTGGHCYAMDSCQKKQFRIVTARKCALRHITDMILGLRYISESNKKPSFPREKNQININGFFDSWIDDEVVIAEPQFLNMSHDASEGLRAYIDEKIKEILGACEVKVKDLATTLFSLTMKVVAWVASGYNSIVLGSLMMDFFADSIFRNFGDGLKKQLDRLASYLTANANKLMEWFKGENETVEPHAGNEVIVKCVMALLGTLMTGIFFHKENSIMPLDRLISGVVKMGAFARGAKFSIDFIVWLVQALYEKLYTWYYGYPPVLGEAGELLEGLDTWFSGVSQANSEYQLHKIKKDQKYVTKVKTLFAKGMDLSKKLNSFGSRAKYETAFRTHLETIKMLYAKVVSFGSVSVGKHIPPFVLMLKGGTAVGKSTIQTQIAKDLLKALGLKDEFETHFYNRNIEQEYWDGYCFQQVVFYDDFGQLKDTQSNPNLEFMEVIRMANTAPFSCHMAALDEKSTTPFISQIVILSTNMAFLDPKSLTAPEAVRRRINFAIDVTRNPNYNESAFSVKYSKFARINPTIENLEQSVMEHYDSYQDMLRDMSKEMITYRQTYLEKHDAITKELEDDSYIYTFDDFARENSGDDSETDEEEEDLTFHVPEGAQEEYDRFLFEDAQPEGLEDLPFIGRFFRPKPTRDEIKSIEKRVSRSEDEFRRICQGYLQKAPEWTPFEKKSVFTAQVDKDMIVGVKNERTGKDSYALFIIPMTLWEKYTDQWVVSLLEYADTMVYRQNIPDDYDYRKMEHAEEYFAQCRPAVIHKQTLRPISQISVSEMAGTDFEGMDAIFKFILKGSVHTLVGAWIAQLKTHAKLGSDAGVAACYNQVRILLCEMANYSMNGLRFLNHVSKTVRIPDSSAIPAVILEFFHFLGDFTIKFATDEVPLALLSKMKYRWVTCLLNYPFTTMVVTGYALGNAIKLIVGLIKMVCGIATPQAESGAKMLSHEHEGLVLGTVVKHTHQCEACAAPFSHTHAIKASSISEQYGPHLCRPCRRLKTEMASSGDQKTSNKMRTIVELATSGDPKTRGPQTSVIELASSGDPRTTNVMSPKIEQGALAAGMTWLANTLGGGVTEAQIQAQMDPSGAQIQNKVLANCYKITVTSDGRTFAVNGIFLHGKVFLTVGHILSVVTSQNGTFSIEKRGMSKPLVFNIANCLYAEETRWDIAVIKFPVNCPDHPDIRNVFATKQDHANTQSFKGVLALPSREATLFKFGDVIMRRTEMRYSSETKTYITPQFYEYSFETAAGDCGSPLFVVDSKLQRKLVGFHVAGLTGRGFALPLFIEMFQDTPVVAKAQMGGFSLDLEHYLAPDSFEKCEIPDGQFLPIGKLKEKPGRATKTNVFPSLVAEHLPPSSSIPAKLTPFWKDDVLLDPIQIGLKKAGVPCVTLDQTRVDMCVRDFSQVLQVNKNQGLCRILTEKEMIQGIEGEDFAPAIRRTTSPGYPWSMWNGNQSGKSKWLGHDEFKYDSMLKDAVDERERLAKMGIKGATFWVDTLKDERRPREKVMAGKTRVFAAGPQDFTLLFRKYFLGFIANTEANRIENEISVGTNVYSFDWARTAAKVSRVGDKVIAGDFSNYDGTLQPAILQAILTCVQDWYDDDEENQLVRRVLWNDIVNSIHICEDNVYQWTHSQPSGCPMTAILNSCYNSLSMRYVYLLCAEKYSPEMATMMDFANHVSMVSYGDDNIINVSDAVCEWFNQITMAEGYKEIGMEYTDEAKSGSLVRWRNISEIAYLKRTFRYEPQLRRLIAPLAEQTLTDMRLWIRGTSNPVEKTLENCLNACFEASLHGEEFYNKFERETRFACNLAGVGPFRPGSWLEWIGPRLTKMTLITAAESLNDARAEAWALDEDQMREGSSWLDLCEDEGTSVQLGLDGGVFTLLDCKPPSEIMGRSPLCNRGVIIANPQMKKVSINNNDNYRDNTPEENRDDPSSALDTQSSIAHQSRAFEQKIVDNNNLKHDPMMNTMKDALARPVVVASGRLTSTVTRYYKTSAILFEPRNRRLLNGYASMSGNFCVRLDMRSSPLDAHLWQFGWNHKSGLNSVEGARHGLVGNHFNSSLVLKFPLTYQTERHELSDIATDYPDCPEVFIKYLGSTSPTAGAFPFITLQGWLEDVELYAAVAQSGQVVDLPTGQGESGLRVLAERDGDMDGIDAFFEPEFCNTFSITSGVAPSLVFTLPTFHDANSYPARFKEMLKFIREIHCDYEWTIVAIKTPQHQGVLRVTLDGAAAKAAEGEFFDWDISKTDTFTIKGKSQIVSNASINTTRAKYKVFVHQSIQAPETVEDKVIFVVYAAIKNILITRLYDPSLDNFSEEGPIEAQCQYLVKTVERDTPVEFQSSIPRKPVEGMTFRELVMSSPVGYMDQVTAPIATTENIITMPAFTIATTPFGAFMEHCPAYAGGVEIHWTPGEITMPYYGATGDLAFNATEKFKGPIWISARELSQITSADPYFEGHGKLVHGRCGEMIKIKVSPTGGKLQNVTSVSGDTTVMDRKVWMHFGAQGTTKRFPSYVMDIKPASDFRPIASFWTQP